MGPILVVNMLFMFILLSEIVFGAACAVDGTGGSVTMGIQPFVGVAKLMVG